MDGFNQPTQHLLLLKQHPLFATANENELRSIATLMKSYRYPPGTLIVEENTLVDSVHFIVKGQAEVVKSKSPRSQEAVMLTTLGAGDTIGLSEAGFFSTTGARQASVIALTDVETFALTVEQIQKLQKQFPQLFKPLQGEASLLLRMAFIKKIEQFSQVTIQELRDLALSTYEIRVAKDEYLFKEGEDSDACYFILKGQVAITRHGEQLATLKEHQVLGETGVILREPRNASALVLKDARFLKLDAKQLRKIVKMDEHAEHDLLRLMHERAHLYQATPIKIINKTDKDGEVIYFLQNEKTNALYQLTSEGIFAWQQINGKRTFGDVIRLFAQKYAAFSPSCLQNLIMDLVENEFVLIEGFNKKVYEKEKQVSLFSRLLTKAPQYLELFYHFRNADRWITKTYPYVSWFFKPISQLICILIITASMLLFILSADTALVNLTELSTGCLTLIYIGFFIPIIFHEYAHAYATKHYGHNIRGLGIGWFWIAPAAYCDTTDILLSPRKIRLIVNVIGVYVQATIAGTCFLAGYLVDTHFSLGVVWIIQFLTYINILYNLNPLLDVDGYYILQDLTEEPDIREKAVHWLIQKGSLKSLIHFEQLKSSVVELTYWLYLIAFVLLIVPLIAMMQVHFLGQFIPAFNRGFMSYVFPLLIISLFFLSVWMKVRKFKTYKSG